MASEGAAWDPKGYLQMEDIALWETSLKRYLEYQPGLHAEHVTIQARRGVRAEFLEAEDQANNEENYLRALVTLAIRGVFTPPDFDPSHEISDEESVLFELEATFAVVYLMIKQPPKERLDHFIRFNCVHNAWPFWRQHVYDTLKRASLPVPNVPLFSGSGRQKKGRAGRGSLESMPEGPTS